MRYNSSDYQNAALSLRNECFVQPWFPHLKKIYGRAVEGPQKSNKDDQRYTWLPWEEQLHRLGNCSLENRQLRGYMIKSQKMRSGTGRVNRHHLFIVSLSSRSSDRWIYRWLVQINKMKLFFHAACVKAKCCLWKGFVKVKVCTSWRTNWRSLWKENL